MIRDALQKVSADRIRRDLFYLCRDPLPFRKVNYTRPGQSVNSLVEADAYIRGQLKSAGYDVTTTQHKVQAFRCDRTKTPSNQWFSTAAAGRSVVRSGEPPGDASRPRASRGDHPVDFAQGLHELD